MYSFRDYDLKDSVYRWCYYGCISDDLDMLDIHFVPVYFQVAELVRELRLELDQLLQDKIENPNMNLCTCPRGSKIIDTIVKLITTQ